PAALWAGCAQPGPEGNPAAESAARFQSPGSQLLSVSEKGRRSPHFRCAQPQPDRERGAGGAGHGSVVAGALARLPAAAGSGGGGGGQPGGGGGGRVSESGAAAHRSGFIRTAGRAGSGGDGNPRARGGRNHPRPDLP